MTDRLFLPLETRQRLAKLASKGYPEESCGLLIGTCGAGEHRVERAVEARNLNRERARDRYELDPVDHLRADEEARRAGLEVVGVWHSHPDHPARPSETDRLAAWEGWSYVIAAVGAEGLADLRSFRLADGNFIEEEIVE